MSEGHTEHKHEVRIHINREPYHSHNPTTGEGLYKLGKIPDGFELYREVHGDHEDELIPKAPRSFVSERMSTSTARSASPRTSRSS